MLRLMYITNNPEIALIAEGSGVDWIFIDMEFIGKEMRQHGLDTVKNHHSFTDVEVIKKVLTKSSLLVRVNPIHDTFNSYPSSKEEIDTVIKSGADIIMLPYFKTVEEVESFISYVDGRSKTCLLLETPEAVKILDKLLKIKGIDYIHIGLNDLHLGLGLKFMFQLLSNGTVDKLSSIIKSSNIPFGFGGIARIDRGLIPGQYILKEHYRLGSSQVILSRSFCNADHISDLEILQRSFYSGVNDIRNLEREILLYDEEDLISSHKTTIDLVNQIVKSL